MFKRHDSPLDAIEGGKMQSDNAATVKGPNELSFDIAPLNDKDLPQAGRIFRIAFGTFLGHPIPKCSGRIETIFVGATVRRTLLGLARR